MFSITCNVVPFSAGCVRGSVVNCGPYMLLWTPCVSCEGHSVNPAVDPQDIERHSRTRPTCPIMAT